MRSSYYSLLIILSLLTIITEHGSAQERLNSFEVISGKKEKTIYTGNLDYFRISMQYKPKIASDSVRYIQGRIQSIHDGMIKIFPETDEKHINFNNDSVINSKTTVCNPTHIVDLKFQDILMIENQSNSNFNWTSVGTSAIITGSITAILIAPLISIKYKTGGFNEKTYFTTAALGLSFVTVGIPITILSKSKKYYFKEKTDGRDVRIWKIKN